MSNASTEFYKAVYLISISACLFTALNLVMHKGDKKIHLVLFAFVGVLLISPLNAYVQLIANSPIKWLSSLSQNLTWAYGPLLLLCVQFALLKPIKWYVIASHFAPFILINIFQIFTLSRVGGGEFLFLLLVIQSSMYCLLALSILIKNKLKLANIALGHPNTTYFWLLFLCAVLFLLVLMDLAIVSLTLMGFKLKFEVVSFVAVGISLYVCFISMFAIYQPSLFFKPIKASLDLPCEDNSSKTTLRDVKLSKEAAMDLNNQLSKLAEEHQFYLDDSISLDKLSALLGVTRNDLSELLNVFNETNFYEYINHLRFTESLRLMDQKQLTIADIAYQSGFNNRNSFYRVFKKETGLTPKNYRLHRKT